MLKPQYPPGSTNKSLLKFPIPSKCRTFHGDLFVDPCNSWENSLSYQRLLPRGFIASQAAQELGGRSVRTSGLGCTSAGFGSSELKHTRFCLSQRRNLQSFLGNDICSVFFI